MSFGLASDQKLLCKVQFDAVFQERNRLYGRFFLTYYRRNDLSFARIGVIISKRNVRLAVHRNRIKRLIKEQFRLQQIFLPSVDIVFVVKKGSGELDNKELTQCILGLLKKLSTSRKEP